MSLILLSLCIVFSSCKYQGSSTSDSNEIFTILYDTLAKEIPAPFPSLPEIYTKEDSIKIYNSVREYRIKRQNRKQIVAIHPFLISGANVEHSGSEMDPEFYELLIKLESLQVEKPLKISRIKTERNDSIIKYNKELLKENVKDFESFDRLIAFSHVSFNYNRTKAAVVASSSTSRLAGFSGAYFFKKKNDRWVLTERLELSIF